MKHRKTQSGYTMIESIAFLGIVIMLGVSVLTLISRMIDKYKLSRIGQQVIELQKAVDLRYAASANYASVSVANLLKEKLAPSYMIANKKLCRNGAINIPRICFPSNSIPPNFLGPARQIGVCR